VEGSSVTAPDPEEQSAERASNESVAPMRRRAFLKATGAGAVIGTGTIASDVAVANATLGETVPVPGTQTAGLGADDTYLYANTSIDGTRRLSKVEIATGNEVDRFQPPFENNVTGYGAANSPESRLFAADFNQSQVKEVDPVTGESTVAFNVPFDPAGIAYDGDRGSLWISDISSNDVHEYSLSGNERSSFGVSGLTTTPAGTGYHAGEIYLGNKEDPGQVYRFDTSGSRQETIDVGPKMRGVAGNSDGVIVPDGNGDVAFLVGSPSGGSGALYAEDFESYASGADPDGWNFYANNSHGVVAGPANDGSQALEVRGDPGGCNECTGHVDAGISGVKQFRVRGAARPTTEGSEGCHAKRGTVNLRPGGGQTYPGGFRLLTFDTSGRILGDTKEVLDSYTPDQWYTFDVVYDRSGSEVVIDYTVNGQSKATVTRQPRSDEGELSHLGVTSGDFSFYFDSVEVTTTDKSPQPSTGTVEGTVTDDSGSSIAGATVEFVTSDTGTTAASVTTGSAGGYSVEIATGTYDVTADADGYNPQSKSVTVETGTQSVGFSLTPEQTTGTVEGTVTDDSGSSIAGATVEFVASDTGTSVASTTTDNSGRYSVEIATGTYDVTADADGYNSQTKSVTVETGSQSVGFSLTPVRTTGTVEGTVTDNTGALIANAVVEFVTSAGTTAASVKTDGDGTYTQEVATGTYEVTADAEGYRAATETVTVADGERRSVDFRLSPAVGTISGTVRGPQGPIQQATVEIVASDTGETVETRVTDDDGNFVYSVLAEQTYEVRANKTGYSPSSEEVFVETDQEETVEITLNSTVYLSRKRVKIGPLETGTPRADQVDEASLVSTLLADADLGDVPYEEGVDRTLAEETIAQLDSAIEAGDLSTERAAEMVDRLLIGERMSRETLAYMGPVSEAAGTDLNFARRTTEPLLRLVVKMLLLKYGVAELIKTGVTAGGAAGAKALLGGLPTLLSDALMAVWSQGLADEEARDELRAETESQVSELWNDLLNSGVSGVSELTQLVDDVIEGLADSVTGAVRGALELLARQYVLLPNIEFRVPDSIEDLTVGDSVWGGQQDLHEAIRPPLSVGDVSPTGTVKAENAVSEALSTMDTNLNAIANRLDVLERTVGELGLLESILDIVEVLQKDLGFFDTLLDLSFEVIQGIAGAVQGVVGIVGDAWAIGEAGQALFIVRELHEESMQSLIAGENMVDGW
jgi:protocatechuate 3,4-dioxygenase beta subunit